MPDAAYALVTAALPSRPRDQFGRVIVQTEEELVRLLEGVHRHEGVEATRYKIRSLISKQSLGERDGPGRVDKVVAMYIKACAACRTAKEHREMPDSVAGMKRRLGESSSKGRNPPNGIRAGKHPFDVVHMDVCTLVHSSFYVIALVCSYSRFGLVRCVERSARAADIVELLRVVQGMYLTTPKVVVSDNGTPFMGEFARACLEFNVEHVLTVPYNQWENGLVERMQGTLKTRVRALLMDKTNAARVSNVRQAVTDG